jgi:hypothetical protein
MKLLLLIIIGSISAFSFGQKQIFVATDIDNFWKAYEKIISTNDTIQKYNYLKELYTDKGTPGLKNLMEVRRYTDKDYIDAIKNYPKFWNSLKSKTAAYKQLYPEIETDIQKLKQAYPYLKPATIYFSIGVFRTNGTVQGERILIGSECALADDQVVTDELPEWRQPFYKTQNPRRGLALLCTHEYVHTQQKPLVENLLSMCLYEGVAEFVSCKATGKKSNVAAIEFGKAKEKEVVDLFVTDLFTMSNDYNWLWGENRNSLKIRDLGYYIGFEICERYYNQAKDKQKAIKELIELDYSDEKEVERIVDRTHLLPQSLPNLNSDYEKRRPTVISVEPSINNPIKPGLTTFRITFSEPLNGFHTSVDFGPLGKDAFPKLSGERIWSADNRSWLFQAELQPNRHYQILISNNFRKVDQIRLKPYLIDFNTTE